jgi:hypothetical protein
MLNAQACDPFVCGPATPSQYVDLPTAHVVYDSASNTLYASTWHERSRAWTVAETEVLDRHLTQWRYINQATGKPAGPWSKQWSSGTLHYHKPQP